MTATDAPDDGTTAARHRPRRGLLLGAGAAAVAVGSAVYVAGWTPLMGVQQVQVEGPPSLSPQALLDAAAIAQGTPMMRVNLRAATARIADLPQVGSVDLRRQWPRTVVISVTARDAAAVRKAANGWELLDTNGAAFAVTPDKPKDLPVLTPAADPATTTAMVQALAGMTEDVRRRVATVQAQSPASIRLTLRKGDAVVNWGTPQDSAFKSEVLAVLLQMDAGWYDVTNPQTPTTADQPPVPKPVPSLTPSPSPSPVATEAAPSAPPSSPAPAVSPLGVVTD